MKREGIVIALAVAVHGTLLGFARAMPEPLTLVARLPRTEMTMIDLGPVGPADRIGDTSTEVDGPREASKASPGASVADEPQRVAPGAMPSTNEASTGIEPAAERIEDQAAVESATGDPGVDPGAAREGPSSEDATGTPVSPIDEYSATVDEGLGGPSIPGLLAPPSSGPSALSGVTSWFAVEGSVASAAPTSTPAARLVNKAKANEVLGSTLIGQSRAKGVDLPATGVVVSSVSDAARALPVPHNTRASFEVKLGPGGKVAGVRVMSNSGGDATTWAGAAKAVAASLASKKLSLGDASKAGATIIVGVTVKHVYPTGSAKGADVKPVCANQLINDIAESMDDSTAKSPDAAIPLFTDENGRPCIPVGFGGTADAANIGATKQIQVRTSTKVLVGGKEALPTPQKVNRAPFWAPSAKEGLRPNAPQKVRKRMRDREKKK